jgi:hypothetical protein
VIAARPLLPFVICTLWQCWRQWPLELGRLAFHPVARHKCDEFSLAVEVGLAEDNVQPRSHGFVGDPELTGSVAEISPVPMT